VVRKVEVMTYRSVKPLGVDSGSMAIESFLQRVLGFTHILNAAYSAGYEVYHVGGGTADVSFDPVGRIVRMTGE
jgi:hypothetical protein